jgi:hypothetical protein
MVRGLDSGPHRRTMHDLAKLRMADMTLIALYHAHGEVATDGGGVELTVSFLAQICFSWDHRGVDQVDVRRRRGASALP